MPKRERRLFFEVEEPGTALDGARRLPLAQIIPNPAQPRQTIDPTALQELADDIAAHGLLLPLLVRPVGDRYQIIAGARRFAAAGLAGLDTVDVRIVAWDDATARAASIRENVHREEMAPADEGRFYATLQAEGMTIRAIAEAVGKTKSYVDRRVQLVSNPAPDPPADLVPARDKPAPFARQDKLWAPFVSAARAAQRLDVTALDADSRATLRDHVDTLLEELDTLRAALD